MREQGYFVDTAIIERLVCARDYLVETDDRLTDIIVEIEELSEDEKARRNEYRSVYEAHSQIDYALDRIEQAFSTLRKA